MHPVLLFVPLDDRPVTFDMVVDLARALGVDVRTPDRALLGDRSRPGDVAAVWDWLEREAGRDTPGAPARALIASVEMLCFGGLVASRKSQMEFEQVAPRLRHLYEIASRVPAYVSAVIPRTPVEPTDEDAPYWKTADLPAQRGHRLRHQRINADLITAAARGALRYLLIGQDDTRPGSPGQAERESLQAQVGEMDTSNVLLTSGADELAARLLARWLSDLTSISPSVRARYTYPDAVEQIPRYEAVPLRQTVDEHIESAGCHHAVEAVDILLWVHNSEGQQQEARDQSADLDRTAIEPVLAEVRDAARQAQVVALADVRFANGADRALVSHLLEAPRYAGIVAYAGWNTCSNAIGSAIALAVVTYHLRAGTLPGSDRDYRPAFFRRILDDWGYQAVVRPRLTGWLSGRGGAAAALGGLEAETEARALDGLRTDALPRLQSSFRYHPMALRGVTFPWHRLFEVRLDLEITRFGRTGPAGDIVVDYDPRWPTIYQEDREAIMRALGPLVRGIEHVGSTAVPGLAAKPIIDIMLGVDVDDLDRVIEPLARIGYEYNPDWEISMPLRRYFRRLLPDGTNTHHLHAVAHGGEFWTRHLRFRDYLRAHPEKAQEYGALKKEIARHRRGSIDYTFAKTEFIRSVEAAAGVEHRRRSVPRERRP